MKNFLKHIQQWVSIWIGIVLILTLSWAVYAWVWITASDWDSLDYTKWNEMVTILYSKITNTWNETVWGIKTFSSFPVTPSSNPSTDYQVSNKKYVDDTVVSVPSWAVMSFNLASCPTGWSEADGTWGTPDLRWTFVRWKNGDANGRDVARWLASYQSDSLQGHWHNVYHIESWVGSAATNFSVPNAVNLNTAGNGSTDFMAKNPISDGSNGTPRTSLETRPKNVALLYCVKN